MKFFLCLLLIFSVFGAEYGFFGITKPAATILREFAESVTYVMNTTGYIQCYDVTKVVPIFFTSPTVTLSNIEIMGIKVTKPLTAAQLLYSVNGADASIKLNSASFGLKAKISLRWTYTVLNWMIYRGGFTADLDAESPTLLFSFKDNTAISTGKIGFTWRLSNAQVFGFGAVDMVKAVIGDMFKESLAPVLNDELNRYNDIIVSSFIYNYFYRNIPLPPLNPAKEPVYLRNVFSKFIFLSKNNSNYLSFAFNSSFYYAIQHVEVPINYPFKPNDELGNNTALYIGIEGIKQIPNQIYEQSKFNITLNSTNLIKIFGYPVTIGVLSKFYPKLTDDYSSDEKLIFTCNYTKNKKGILNVPFSCAFKLENNPSITIFDIEKIQLTTQLEILMKPEDSTKKTINVRMSQPRYTELRMKSPKLPKYIEKQIENLLQPISRSNGVERNIPIQIVGANMNWEFVNIVSTENGDATLYYRLK